MINLIWAMTKNHLIGKGNLMPWHIKEDLVYKDINNKLNENHRLMNDIDFSGKGPGDFRIAGKCHGILCTRNEKCNSGWLQHYCSCTSSVHTFPFVRKNSCNIVDSRDNRNCCCYDRNYTG